MDIGFTPDQSRVAREFISYTMSDIAALCATRGWDERRGQSVERLQADLTPASLGYRRGMVVGRQLFFFSHVYRLTTDPLYEDRARRLFADLVEHFWDQTHGGWYFSLDDDNAPHDPTKDLYCQAFVMFGLSHYYAIFSDADALHWLRRTDELVRRHFALPGGWFAPSTTRDWVILGRNLAQNPHMHLLEAYLSAYSATRDDAFLKNAIRMMSIYTELLRSRDGSKVLENFDENGQPAGEAGRRVEPGHFYEWYWLVNEYADIAGLPAYRAACGPLIDWADRSGVDAGAGGIYDVVDTDGNVVSTRKRIWPVTECIKARATLARIRPSEQSNETLVRWIRFIGEAYCAGSGTWHEYLNQRLKPDSDYMPMSTPYHVAMAALEVEKLLGGPGAFGLQNKRSPASSPSPSPGAPAAR